MNPSFDKMTHSKFYELGGILWDIIVLSILWLIFSLPVVTSGASSAALYYAVYKRFRKRSGNPTGDFFHSFKMNLKQGLILSIIIVAFGSLVFLNIQMARLKVGNIALPDWYLPFAILLIVPFCILYSFMYPYLARFSNDTKHVIMISCTLASMNLPKSFLLLILGAASMAVMILFPPCVLFVPFLAAYLRMRIVEPVFEKALRTQQNRENKAAEEDEDDNEEIEGDLEDA